MSLFDDASLAMIPSAYKDGKLYSIKPTDGSGDFTFTRGSNLAATRVDVNGLIEKGRENVLLQSNNFDTTWATTDASVTSGQSGYDGSNNAWLLEVTATGSYRRVYQSGINLDVNTFSIYAKANTSNFLFLLNNKSSTDAIAWFDLSDGSIGGVNGAIDTSIESVGNGWYRCSVTSVFADNQYFVSVADGIGNVTGTTGASLYIQDAQLEQGLVATDYIETTTTTAQAGILEDMPRLDYSGGASCPSLLLEPTRTNLITQSELFSDASWIKSGASVVSGFSSPDGGLNAFKLVEGVGGTFHFTQSTPLTVSSGATVTHSIYAKKGERDWLVIGDSNVANQYCWFDLLNGVIGSKQSGVLSHSIEFLSNGFYKCIATYTVPSTASRPIFLTSTGDGINSYTGDGTSGVYIYGAQLEQGSYPTSYIPTYGTSQTRSLDLTTADTSSFYTDSSKGTLFTEISFPLAADGNYNGWFFWNGSTYYRIVLQRRGDTGKGQVEVRINNTTQASIISPSAITLEDNHKMLVRWDGSVFTLFLDGANIGSDTSTDIFSGTNLNELASRPTYNAANIKQAVLFPTALTDSECIALTTL